MAERWDQRKKSLFPAWDETNKSRSLSELGILYRIIFTTRLRPFEGGPEGPEDPMGDLHLVGNVSSSAALLKITIFFWETVFKRRRRGSCREEFSLRISVFLFPDFFPFSFFDSLFTQVCAMGTTVVSMKDVFKAAKWHDCLQVRRMQRDEVFSFFGRKELG